MIAQPRPEVMSFARVIERMLEGSDGKKDKDDWHDESYDWLFGRLRDAIDDLNFATTVYPKTLWTKTRVGIEAGRVACFAFIVLRLYFGDDKASDAMLEWKGAP